jgi:tetratricopeptide (TPR) repeat protein
MRILAILGGIVLVLLAGVGVAAWRVTAPMRFDGVERDAAAMRSRGELVEVSHPGITRLEIVEMLRAREFEALTAILETRNERALADAREEWELGRVVDAFAIRDDDLADEFDDWIQASPDSFAPLIAAASQRFVLAFMQRGTRTARETTPEQFSGMSEQLGLLVEDVQAALSKEPRLSEAYVLLIDAARAGGTQLDCGNFAKLGLEVMPASYRIRSALAICRLPRWGGSYRRIEAIAKAADPFFADNPQLAALHGIVDWDRGRDAKGARSIELLTSALNSGAAARYYTDRAAEYRSAKRFEESLEDIDAALELAPDSPDLLVDRMYSLLGLGRHDEIPALIELVEAIDPLNTDLPGFKDYALKVAAYEAHTMQKGKQHAASIDRLNQGLAIDAGDAQAYFVRGRGYLQAGDHDKALEDFETAIRLDDSYFAAYVNLDYILALRGEWPRIIAMWDAYLAKYPNDGKAVFERAGAIRHGGDETRGWQEAQKACDMGVTKACATIRRR